MSSSSSSSSSAAAAATTAATAVSLILKPQSEEGKAEARAVSIIQDSFHILNYLPIIVLVVILLIAFVSSDLLTGNWPIFVSMILTFLYVLYIHSISPNNFLKLKDSGDTIFPSPPDEDFTIKGSSSEKIIRIVIPVAMFILGLGMGFGSIQASVLEKVSNLDLTRSMIGFGSILLIGALIFGLYKSFGENKPISEWIHYIVISILIGVPMIVRGNEIQQNMDKVKRKQRNFRKIKRRFNIGFRFIFSDRILYGM